MRRDSHVFIGLVGTFFIAFLLAALQSFSLDIFIIFGLGIEVIIAIAIASIIGSMLPDVIEPSLHWTHRKEFHSNNARHIMGVLSLFLFVAMFLQVIFGLGVNYSFAIFAFVFSYFLHLVADSTTKMGLPDK